MVYVGPVNLEIIILVVPSLTWPNAELSRLLSQTIGLPGEAPKSTKDPLVD